MEVASEVALDISKTGIRVFCRDLPEARAAMAKLAARDKEMEVNERLGRAPFLLRCMIHELQAYQILI